MKHICAWCQEEISPPEEKQPPLSQQPPSSPFTKWEFKKEAKGEEITHGICRGCADAVLADAKAATFKSQNNGSQLISGQ